MSGHVIRDHTGPPATSRRGRRSRSLIAAATIAAATLFSGAVALPAQAIPPQGPDGRKAPRLDYVVQDPGYFFTTGTDPATGLATNCFTRGAAFAPTSYTDAAGAAATSKVAFGEKGGASYKIEYPAAWNGELVLWAHGFAGTKKYLCSGAPNIDRAWYLAHGYAWASSSYATNTYDVAQGVKDTHDLLAVAKKVLGKPSKVWITGESMGGHIVARSIEQYPNAYDGALPTCGALGDSALFSYFLDVNVTAAALAGTKAPFPTTDAQYTSFVDSTVLPAIGATMPGKPAPTALFAPWDATVVNASGGLRPGAVNALPFYWDSFGFGDAPANSVPFLFGVYPGTTGGTIGVARGNVTDNTRTVYRTSFDLSTPLSAFERQLNATALRVAADPSGSSKGLTGIPAVAGDPTVPVLTLHGLGDLFVPFSMEQVYAQRVAAHGRSDLLVQRAIRNVAHCSFTQPELTTAFTDLVGWAKGGAKPAGDVVTDPAVVARQTYGCTFTDPTATASYTRSKTFFTTACP